MEIDTQITLFGDNAKGFQNQMEHVDVDAILARDSFISDVDSKLDDDGILTIVLRE